MGFEVPGYVYLSQCWVYHPSSGVEAHNHNLMLLTSSCMCWQSLRSGWSPGILGTLSLGVLPVRCLQAGSTFPAGQGSSVLTRSSLQTVLEQCDLVRQSIAERSCHQIPVWVSSRQAAPLEGREPVCHRTDVEPFGRLCC